MTFGVVFLMLLAVTTAYTIVRMIHEHYRPPAASEGPDVIPFHQAVRLSRTVARQRFLAESPTVVLTLPDIPAAPAKVDPGARTVDLIERLGRHRRTEHAEAAVPAT